MVNKNVLSCLLNDGKEVISHIFAYQTTLTVRRIFHRRVWSRTFSALCVYLKFGHHPHLLGYIRAKFLSFVACIAELARGEILRTLLLNHSLTQSINQSLTQLFDAPGTEAKNQSGQKFL